MSNDPDYRPTVMLVDDDEQLCILLNIILKREGFNPFTFTSGTEALQWLGSNVPDAIVIDINMPEMDGFELMQRIGDVYSGPSFPKIMVSARMDEEAAQLAHAGGADAWLEKAADWRRLIDELKSRIEPSGDE